MLAASSAVAANSITFTWKGGTSTVWRDAGNWSPDITYATLSSGTDAASLDESVQENTFYPGGVVYKSGSREIKAVIPYDANLILNGSLIGNVDVISIDASEGRVSGVNYTGAVALNLGAYDMRGKLALKVGSGSDVVINAAGGKLNVSSATSWDVYGNLTLNAPVSLTTTSSTFEIIKHDTTDRRSLIVRAPIARASSVTSGATICVSLDASASTSSRVTLTTDQSSLLSAYTTLKAGKNSVLLFDTDASSSPTVELGEGAVFNVGSGHTVTLTAASNGITSATKFTKAGAGTLKLVGARGSLRPTDTATATYANKYYVVKLGVLASLDKLAQITVSAGNLSIAADTADSDSGGNYQTEGRYITSRDVTTSAGTVHAYDYTPAITVATGKSLDIVVKSGATLDVGTYSIREQIAPTEAVKITVENGGTANIAEMGIFSRAYEDGVTTAALVDSSDNYATPEVYSRVSLDISGTLNITGTQAVRTITNSNTAGKGGAITVADGEELILVLDGTTSKDLEAAYYNYYGTIEADSVGLIGKFANYPFRVGVNDAVVTIKTLKVYGGSELMLDDQTLLSSSESIYLRKKGSNSSFSAMTVGKLTITSGEVEIPGTLKIDGAGRSTGVALITFSKDVTKSKTDTKPALTVTTTEIHANASEVGTDYVGGLAMVVSGDGALTLNTVTGNPVNAHPDAAVRVTSSADLVLNGSIPATSGITVNEGATLEVAQGVRIPGNLDLNRGAILKATLTAPNATSNGTYAVTVEKGLTLSTNISLDVELADEELGNLPTTYSRTYKVVGVTDAANLKVISKDNFDVALLNENTANIFKTKTSTISTDTFLDEKGVFLELAANIQQPVLGEASFDKSTFGANKQFTVMIPVTYSSAYSEHYKNYITVNSVDANINANGVRAIASYNPTTGLVTVAGTSTTNTAEIEVKIGWIKGTSTDLANSYSGLGANRNTSVATAMDETVSKRHWVDIDGLALDFFIPMTKKITLEGTAEVVDPTEPEEVEGIEITPADADGWAVDPASPDALLKFTVKGLRVAVSTNALLPTLVDGKYVWNNGYDTTKTYEMLSSDGNYYAVDPVVVVVDGEGVPMDNVTIEPSETESNAADVFIPTNLVASNSDTNGTLKEIAIRGTLEGGKVVSSPKITVTVTKNHLGTVEVDGGTAQTDADGKVTTYEPYTITASDDLGTVPAEGWTVSDLPEWLEANPEAGTLELLLKQDYTGTVTAGPVVVTVVANGTVGTRTYRVAINVVGAKGTFDSIVVPSNATQSSVQNGSNIAPITFRTSPDVPASWDISTEAPSWIAASGNNTATFTLSGTASETTFPATYTFTVTATADGKTDTATVSITVVEPVLAVEFDDSGASMVEGYNYRATLTASNASGDVTWSLASAPAWIKVTKTGATTAVLEGLVPAYVDDFEDEDPNEIAFTVTATDASGATAEQEVSITVEEDSYVVSSTVPSYVAPAAGVELGTVKADYTVDIDFPVDEDGVPTITVDDLESINLPSWLTYEPKMNADEEVTGLVLKYNAVNGVAQGTRGSVRIPVSGADDYDVLGWDVVYDVPAPALEFTLGKTSMNLRVGSSDTVALTATNVQGTVNFTYTANPATGLTVSIAEGVATVTAATAGTYTVTFTATDERGADGAKTADLSVTVTSGETPGPGPNPPAPTTFGVTATPTTLNVVAGSTATVTLAASNAQGTVSYTASQTWVTFSGNTATFAPTTAGTYTVTITATDAGRTTANTATATVTVTVTEPEPEAFALSTTRSVSLNLATLGGNTSTITLAPANALGAVSYTYTVTPSTGLTVSISGNSATLTAEETGTYTVVFTATDAGRTTDNTATFTTTVTVGSGITSPDVRSIGSSSGGCDAGFGALALVLAAPLFLRRRRS